MEKGNWCKLFVATTLLVVALAAVAAAQDPTLDFAITGIQVENSKGDFRILPSLAISSTGPQADHNLSMILLLDGFLKEEISSVMDYVQNNHTCHNYTWPNCGQGDCLTLYGWYYTAEGVCLPWQLFRCACVWFFTPEFDWVGYTGQMTATVIVDPYDEIAELDEDNNEMTIELEPVATEGRTWAAVKVLYR